MLATGSSWLSHQAVNCPFVRRTVTIISRFTVSVWNQYTPGAEGGTVCHSIRAGNLSLVGSLRHVGLVGAGKARPSRRSLFNKALHSFAQAIVQSVSLTLPGFIASH